MHPSVAAILQASRRFPTTSLFYSEAEAREEMTPIGVSSLLIGGITEAETRFDPRSEGKLSDDFGWFQACLCKAVFF